MAQIKKYFHNISFERNTVIISSFITLNILYWCFKNTDFSLVDFSKLYISMATLDGVDVGIRVSMFFKSISLGVFLFLLIYILLFKLSHLLQMPKSGLNNLSAISATGLLLIFSNIIGLESSAGIHFFLLLFLFTFLLIILANKFSLLNLINKSIHYECLLIIAFLITVSFLFLFNSTANIISVLFLIYFGTVILLIVLILFAGIKLKITPEKIFYFLIPLSFVPVFIFLSIELQFLVKYRLDNFIPYKKIFIITLALSFFVHLVRLKLGRSEFPLRKIIAYFFVPSALLSFLLLTRYNPIIAQPTDIFELANPANAMMRIFAFNEIPFVDFMTSHMFSEQFYGIFYNLIFGYDGSLDFLTYEFLYEVLNYFVAWYFTYRLLKNPVLAFLIVLAFPFVHIYYRHHLILSLVVFFTIRNLLQRQNTLSYLFVLLTTITIVVIRLDVGIATLLSTLIFLPLYFFSMRIKINYYSFLKSLICVLLGFTTLIIFFSIIRSPEYILNHFRSAYHYISANQAHGYSNITNTYSQQFFLSHFLFPILSVFIIIYSFNKIRVGKYGLNNQKTFILSSSIFLYLVYLFNFQRGLVRHGYIGGIESYLVSTFYLATTVFIFSFLKKNNTTIKYISFLGLSFFIVIFLKYFPINKRTTYFEKLLTSPTIISLDNQFNSQQYTGRVLENRQFNEHNYNELKIFLNNNLNKEQTFLDFSNSPMLYYYCQRKVPSYFCQSLQNTVDDFLQMQLLKKTNPREVPVVIFSNYPPNWFDNTDGVPNVMRQYMIAEYIFTNYKPFAVIDNRSIWIRNSAVFNWDINEIDTLTSIPKTYHYKKAAYAINEYFDSVKHSGLELIKSVEILDEENSNIINLDIEKNISKESGIFLKFDLVAPGNEQEITIQLKNNDDIIGTTKFTTSSNYSYYLIPLSIHYLWHAINSTNIEIIKNVETKINKIEIYKDNRFENKTTANNR